MALRTLVKVGEINNLSDARFCAGMGVDFAGFNLDEGSTVSPELFLAITGWIEGIKIVGEFETSTPAQIEALHEQFNFDFVQISDIEVLTNLNVSCPKIFKININKSIQEGKELINKYNELIEYFLIESENIELINTDEAKKIEELSRQYSILLAYGINASDIEKILDTAKPLGISLKGGEEIRPGYKDFDELGDILEAIEID